MLTGREGGSTPDIIRTPNHLGDLVMALPALAAAPAAHLVTPRWLAPLVALLTRTGRLIPFDRGTRGMLAAAREIRRLQPHSGVLLPPSLSSALMFRLGGVDALRGTATDGRRLLLADAVPATRVRNRHRADLYHELVTGVAGLDDGQPGYLVPRLPVTADLLDQWHATLREHGHAPLVDAGTVVGIFPGSNARSRRWDADRFAGLARRLQADGVSVIVFGAASEAGLTAAVAGPHAADMGGRTPLPVLAAALSACHILVTNDSGPMHLAAAVGTRTLVVSGPADTRETAPRGAGHVYLQRLDLPCVPCVRNECPRRGAGFILPEAERECLRLIEVPEVLSTVHRMLTR